MTDSTIYIDQLSKKQLIDLNHQIVDRLKELEKQEALRQISMFKMFDIVSFNNEGKKTYGVVLKIHQRTITVCTANEESWKMPPSYLKLETKPPKKALELQNEFLSPLKKILGGITVGK